jgi:hypothetical protein
VAKGRNFLDQIPACKMVEKFFPAVSALMPSHRQTDDMAFT